MKTYVDHHPISYASLVFFLSLCLSLFIFYRYDPGFQMRIGVALSTLYFVWGVSHHIVDGDLNLKITLEYALISLLGITILFSLLGGVA